MSVRMRNNMLRVMMMTLTAGKQHEDEEERMSVMSSVIIPPSFFKHSPAQQMNAFYSLNNLTHNSISYQLTRHQQSLKTYQTVSALPLLTWDIFHSSILLPIC